MNEHENNVNVPVEETMTPTPSAADLQVVHPEPEHAGEPHPVNAVRAAAGRLGAQRVHELMKLGMEYEREHGLKAGRQRQRQLIQLGRRYELEHGLAVPKKPRRRKRGDAWKDFVTALARVVKPAYRPGVERLVAELQQPRAIAG